MRAAFKKLYNPAHIRAPAVAIYAIPKPTDDLVRRDSSDRLPFPEPAPERLMIRPFANAWKNSFT